MAQHQSFAGYEQSFGNCGGGGGGGGSELLGLQSGMEMLSLPPTGSLYPTQINQGLSLSLHHSQNFHHHQTNLHFSGHQQQQQQQVVHQDEGRIFYHQGCQLKNSMYLRSAQELLDEFCRLGGESSCSPKQKQKQKLPYSASSSWNQSLLSMDVLELQKRKALLLSMLEEVDQRYKRYKEQMQAVVSSFEAVAGEGSANVYSRLASKAMSKHFRCLRDGIVDQIQAMKKAMREKDASMVASGSMKGETPRLRLLDQCFRQQKAQAGLMESQPWRPQRGLPERSVTVLRAWLFEHFLHPYPSDVDKHILARQTGLSRSQVSNWFINARVRLWKPMVEEMYIQETKDEDNINESSQMTPESDNNIDSDTQPTHLLSPSNGNSNPNPSSSYYDQDQKPQLVAHHHLQINDSGTLSSIPRAENFGVVDLDFSSYSNNNNQSFGHGHGVSLTLGLQQSLMFSRDQFAVLGGDEQAQNLPYRDLMGSQLLHDLAG